jgi:hypothetical protein
MTDGCTTVSGSSPGKAWARIAVRIRPGSTIETRIGMDSISSAQHFSSASAPALVAAYMPQKALGAAATLVVR